MFGPQPHSRSRSPTRRLGAAPVPVSRAAAQVPPAASASQAGRRWGGEEGWIAAPALPPGLRAPQGLGGGPQSPAGFGCRCRAGQGRASGASLCPQVGALGLSCSPSRPAALSRALPGCRCPSGPGAQKAPPPVPSLAEFQGPPAAWVEGLGEGPARSRPLRPAGMPRGQSGAEVLTPKAAPCAATLTLGLRAPEGLIRGRPPKCRTVPC